MFAFDQSVEEMCSTEEAVVDQPPESDKRKRMTKGEDFQVPIEKGS